MHLVVRTLAEVTPAHIPVGAATLQAVVTVAPPEAIRRLVEVVIAHLVTQVVVHLLNQAVAVQATLVDLAQSHHQVAAKGEVHRHTLRVIQAEVALRINRAVAQLLTRRDIAVDHL